MSDMLDNSHAMFVISSLNGMADTISEASSMDGTCNVYNDPNFSNPVTDDVTAQLASAGPVGVAAAAAISTSKNRKRPHSFEINPTVRKRQQTRLLRKLLSTLSEYTTRVGQQAVLLCCTPGKINPLFYRVFGSQPLENVLKEEKYSILTDLDNKLSLQAPHKSTVDDYSKHKLPPLNVDGIPTPIDKMTQAQLRMFIPEMLRYSTNRTKPGWGKLGLMPAWWPHGVPWANIRCDMRSEEEKQRVPWTSVLRDIVLNCYTYHDRLDLLPMYRDDNHNNNNMEDEDGVINNNNNNGIIENNEEEVVDCSGHVITGNVINNRNGNNGNTNIRQKYLSNRDVLYTNSSSDDINNDNNSNIAIIDQSNNINNVNDLPYITLDNNNNNHDNINNNCDDDDIDNDENVHQNYDNNNNNDNNITTEHYSLNVTESNNNNEGNNNNNVYEQQQENSNIWQTLVNGELSFIQLEPMNSNDVASSLFQFITIPHNNDSNGNINNNNNNDLINNDNNDDDDVINNIDVNHNVNDGIIINDNQILHLPSKFQPPMATTTTTTTITTSTTTTATTLLQRQPITTLQPTITATTMLTATDDVKNDDDNDNYRVGVVHGDMEAQNIEGEGIHLMLQDDMGYQLIPLYCETPLQQFIRVGSVNQQQQQQQHVQQQQQQHAQQQQQQQQQHIQQQQQQQQPKLHSLLQQPQYKINDTFFKLLQPVEPQKQQHLNIINVNSNNNADHKTTANTTATTTNNNNNNLINSDNNNKININNKDVNINANRFIIINNDTNNVVADSNNISLITRRQHQSSTTMTTTTLPTIHPPPTMNKCSHLTKIRFERIPLKKT